MIDDPIVEEIHKIRERLSGQYDFDIQKIFDSVRQKEREHRDRVVNLRAGRLTKSLEERARQAAGEGFSTVLFQVPVLPPEDYRKL